MQKNILKIVDNEQCCGCGVCAGVCPFEAIEIELNEYGFFRPKIDEDKCTSCGKCLRMCSMPSNRQRMFDLFGKYVGVYSGWNNNQGLRTQAASGGLATAISQWCLNEGYKVIGTTYNQQLRKTELKIISNLDDLKSIASSKYMPSEYSGAIGEIGSNKDQKYLIVALPCQIMNLRKALGERENIIYIDIFCGRVVSNFLTERYIAHKGFVNPQINFRDKKTGWGNFSILLKEEENEFREVFRESIFGKVLNAKLATQNICYECKAGASGDSDITLGDYWNCDYGDEASLGVSIIVARTKLGNNLVQSLQKGGLVSLKNESASKLLAAQGHLVVKLNKKKLKKANKKLLNSLTNKENSLSGIEEEYKDCLDWGFFSKVRRKGMLLIKKAMVKYR